VIPLNLVDGKFNFLICGGQKKYMNVTDVYCFTANVETFQESKLELLMDSDNKREERLFERSSIRNNLYFPMSKNILNDSLDKIHPKQQTLLPFSDIIGLPSHQGLHIFDKTSVSWITTINSLAFS